MHKLEEIIFEILVKSMYLIFFCRWIQISIQNLEM